MKETLGFSGQRAGDNRMVRGSDGRAVASRTRSKERNCLHVGAEREVNCEHVQAMIDESIAQTWGARIGEVRGFWGFLKSHTACVASFDMRTAFDVAKTSVVSRIPTCMVTRGHVVEALLEGMQAVMVICFDNCGTEFRFA